MKNSLEIVTEQVRLEGGFKRGGRIRVAECLRQTVPNRWASVKRRSFTKCFCVYTRADKGSRQRAWRAAVLSGRLPWESGRYEAGSQRETQQPPQPFRKGSVGVFAYIQTYTAGCSTGFHADLHSWLLYRLTCRPIQLVVVFAYMQTYTAGCCICLHADLHSWL